MINDVRVNIIYRRLEEQPCIELIWLLYCSEESHELFDDLASRLLFARTGSIARNDDAIHLLNFAEVIVSCVHVSRTPRDWLRLRIHRNGISAVFPEFRYIFKRPSCCKEKGSQWQMGETNLHRPA
jgi:hypothetical protein